ncbi:MAG: hypothetical protein RSD63_07180 [Eubacterium sp.]
MLDLEYTEIDGLLYPNIELGVEDIENELSKYSIMTTKLDETKQE